MIPPTFGVILREQLEHIFCKERKCNVVDLLKLHLEETTAKNNIFWLQKLCLLLRTDEI